MAEAGLGRETGPNTKRARGQSKDKAYEGALEVERYLREAHEICSKIEFDLRWRRPVEDFVGSRSHKLVKADVPKLTSPEFFQFVLKKYVR